MKAEWMPISTRPDEDRIRFIGAIEGLVVGDLFYGVASLTAGESGMEGYFERQMIRCFRYTDSERPVPDHLTPTYWTPLPDTPEKLIERTEKP